jgi:hypothetical protein
LEYMAKCALRGIPPSSTPLALSFVRYDSKAEPDPCRTQPGNGDQSPVRTVDPDAGQPSQCQVTGGSETAAAGQARMTLEPPEGGPEASALVGAGTAPHSGVLTRSGVCR